MQFKELPLCDTLLDGLQAMNFKETTPIQEQAIPVILEKKDVIACAQTGTGKTAAFLLPLLNNLQTDAHEEGKINAIIMAPTRELAQQIDQQMEGFSYYTPFSSVAVYGGNDGDAWDVQKRGLLSGADVVIATPGRLLSHINLYNIEFSGVKYFILDEADRMLDMGFHDDIMKIEKLLPKDRQTIMFSATMPPKIQQLAKNILRNPVDITIAIARPPETILQSAYICHEAQKISIVKSLFKDKAPKKVILFSGSKQKVKEIAKILSQMGLSAGEMHSDLDQSQRNHVMHEFKNERVSILVATDIVARGIDIDDITLVINFDVPYDAEDYVHRIGRTARAGDSGMAITFVSPDEQYRFSRIEQFLGKKIYRIPVPSELGETPEYNPVRDNRKGGNSNRSSKGSEKRGKEAGKKGGKASQSTLKPSGSGNHEKTEKIRNPQNQKENEGSFIERDSQTEGTHRQKKNMQKNGTSHHEVSPRHDKGAQMEANLKKGEEFHKHSTIKKQNRDKKEGVVEGKVGIREQNETKGKGSSENKRRQGERKKPQSSHPQRTNQDFNPRKGNGFDRKKASTPQDTAPSQKKTEKTEKQKKWWSWLPFVKK